MLFSPYSLTVNKLASGESCSVVDGSIEGKR